ncbi:MAG: gliding motility-associated peptidyl-prolyl isomerase [Flavobacteriales bacterium]|jgi:gliding motility-associated peptidyl-prolyl isomerase
MKNALHLIWILLLFAACKSPEARRPISQKSGTRIDNSIVMNKKRIAIEEADIQKIIARDTTHVYAATEGGFWYTYEKRDTIATQTPLVGELVSFNYNLSTITGNSILSTAAVGDQVYQIDQSNQDLISGIREGLKLMKEGETITVLLPSHKAYGYYGFEDKIGSNVSIRSTITLNKIKTKTDD